MSEPFLGQIIQVGFNFPPRGWASCDGQLLPIFQNSALFSLLGTTYGGDGETTFALPDLRGRSMVHVGNGPGLPSVQWGQRSGNTTFTLQTSNLPAHNHSVAVNGGVGNSDTPVNAFPSVNETAGEDWHTAGGAGQFLAANAIGNTGGGQAVTHRSPFLGVYHVIALTGIYPSSS